MTSFNDLCYEYGLFSIEGGKKYEVPVAEVPIKFSIKNFKEAFQLQRVNNLLFLRALNDESNFNLKCEDEMYKILKEIYDKRESACNIKAVYIRADYMCNEQHNIKLIENNLIANSNIVYGPLLNKIHSTLYEDIVLSSSDSDFISFIKKIYTIQGSKGVALMVDDDTSSSTSNYIEKKLIIEYLKRVNISMVHVSINDLLDNIHFIDKRVYYKEAEVFTLYYRYLYNAEHYTREVIDLRIKLESSTACSIPSVDIQILGLKSHQIKWQRNSEFTKYLNIEDGLRIQNTYGRYKKTGEYKEGDHEKYVLKTLKEGGNSNLFGEDILKKDIKGSFLMEKINSVIIDHTIPEVGIFGGLLEVDGEIIYNSPMGYICRSKDEKKNECGISSGYGFLDSLRN